MHSTGPGRYNSYRCDGGFRYNFEWVRQITFVIWSSIPSGLLVYVYCGECDLVVSFGWGIKTTCEGRICTIKTSVGDIKTKLFPTFFQSRCKLYSLWRRGDQDWCRIDPVSNIFFLFPSRWSTLSSVDCSYNSASGRWASGQRQNVLRVFYFVTSNWDLDCG